MIGNRLQGYLQNSFIRSFTTVLGVDILVKASGFILLPVFLRLMSQEEFGLYNYLLSIIQTFSLVLNLGLYVSQSKLYHTYGSRQERGQLLFTIIVTLLAFLGISYLVMILFGWDEWIIRSLFDNHPVYGQYKGIVLLSLLVTVLSFMLTNFFYTSEKIRLVKNYNISRILLINLMALAALYFFRKDAVGTRLKATYLTELVLLGVFSVYFIRELVPNFSRKLMWKSFKLGLPIMVSALFGIVVNFSDKFLLQKYGSLKDLSNYYLAFSFASIIPLIFASLQNVWLPVFLKEKDMEKNFKRTRSLLSKLLVIFFALALLIWGLFTIMLWTRIIPSKYTSVIWILPILLVTQIFSATTSLLTNYLIYFEKTSLASLTGAVMSGISLGLGLWLVPVWGVYGAAVTTVTVSFLYMITYYNLIGHLKKKYLLKAAPVKPECL
ncbi:MAG: lipopolysaccharide biosynthesis protein [Flavisolibacter sp.]